MIERDYVRFALDHYQAPVFSMEEFTEDLNKVIALKKLFRRYTNDGKINERLALNMITLVLNQFGITIANTILFYKVEPEHHGVLMTFLAYLNSFKMNDHVSPGTTLDPVIIDKLREATK